MKFRSIQLSIAVLAGACLFVAVAAMAFYAMLAFERNQETVAERSEQIIEELVREQLLATASAEAFHIRQQLERPFAVNEQLALLNRQIADVRDGLPQVMISREEMLRYVRQVLEDQPELLSAYVAWEPGAFDDLDTSTRGPACRGTTRLGSSCRSGSARPTAPCNWTCLTTCMTRASTREGGGSASTTSACGITCAPAWPIRHWTIWAAPR